MKHLYLFEEYKTYSFSYDIVEDFDEEYQAYSFNLDDGTPYVILIEDIRMSGNSRYFVRFRPKNPLDGTFIDYTNKGNVIKIINTVLNAVSEYSERFNNKTFYFSPSSDKRLSLFTKMLDKQDISYEIQKGNETLVKFFLN